MKKLTLALCVAATLAPSFAMAHQAGDFIVRAGTATVRPTESSENVMGLGGFKIDNDTQLGLTFSYLITDNIGVELLGATPFQHKVGLQATGDIASSRQLPPTLMAQWYFGKAEDKLRPYVGVGINYTNFYDAKFNNTGKSLGLHDLSVDNSWGAAGQVGLDYMVDKDWMINASLWYMDIDTTIKFRGSNNQKQNIDTHVDPFVFMFAVGYRF